MADPQASNSGGSVNLSELTDTQRQALASLMEVTAQTAEQAIPLLRSSEWNVEISIAKFFDGTQPDPIAEARREQEAASEAAARALAQEQSSPRQRTNGTSTNLPQAPRLPPPSDALATRPPLLITVLLYPFSILFRFSSSIFTIFQYLFPFLPFLRRGTLPTPRRSTNPRDTAARFIRSFNEEYTPAHPLPFLESGYSASLDLCKSSLKPLLVVLISPGHDLTPSFVRTVLLAPEFLPFLEANNMLLWAGSTADSEAYQLSTALSCTRFPFMALIAPTMSGASVIARVSGPMTPGVAIGKLTTALTAHQPAYERARQRRQEQQAARALRDEQNAMYERSLEQDRRRARERAEREEAERREAQRRAEAEAAIQLEDLNLKRWRRWRKSRLLPEPSAGEGIARVGIRLKDGQKTVRRFAKDTKLEEVFAFVECFEVEETGERPEPPSGWNHTYKFRLATSYPRKEFVAEDAGEMTLGQAGLFPSGNLVVEADDESEGED